MDGQLCRLGSRYLGENSDEVEPERGSLPAADEGMIALAVFGAHMKGLPLNHQLTHKGARLLGRTTTTATYRLYALPGGMVARPALVHATVGGRAIECEVWELGAEALGRLIVEVAAPLGIGTVEMADGSRIKGFICEPRGIDGSVEITQFGGWRAWLEFKKSESTT